MPTYNYAGYELERGYARQLVTYPATSPAIAGGAVWARAITLMPDMERFTDRTPAPFFVAIADDPMIIVRRPGATCYLHKAAGKESSKAVCKRQIVWPHCAARSEGRISHKGPSDAACNPLTMRTSMQIPRKDYRLNRGCSLNSGLPKIDGMKSSRKKSS